MGAEQAGAVVIQVTTADFGRLCENSGEWPGWQWHTGRFETMDISQPPSFREWRRVYWLGQGYVAVIFARAFLAARGFDYEVLFDTASDQPDGPMFGYVILTDYEAELS